jgi:hypothetical protein
MRKPKNILEALGIVDFDDDLENGIKLGQKEELKPENKADLEKASAEVAGIAALVKLLSAAVEAAEEDEKKEEGEENEEPVKGAAWKNDHAHGFCDRDNYLSSQDVDKMIMGAGSKRAEKENKKSEKIPLKPADLPMFNMGKLYYPVDFLSEKKRKLVLHDTVEQEAEALAQSHEKMLKALSQVEPDGMDYHMIKEMVKYIDILHSVRCSAERVASILTKD